MARDFETVSTRSKVAAWVMTGYASLMYLFLLIPILLIIVFSFNQNKFGTFPFTGWTTQWYQDVFADEQIKSALIVSLQVAVQVTLLSVLVGVAAAFPLVRAPLRFRNVVRVGFTVPLMIPGLLIGVSLLVLIANVLHVSLSAETAVLGQAVYTTPFVILVVAARLDGFDRSLERAAADLGASKFQAMRLIVLPLLAPAILGGAMFAFTLSFDEFIITSFLIGNENTIPIYIYTQIKYGVTPEVNALAALVLVASIVILGVVAAIPVVVRRLRRTNASSASVVDLTSDDCEILRPTSV